MDISEQELIVALTELKQRVDNPASNEVIINETVELIRNREALFQIIRNAFILTFEKIPKKTETVGECSRIFTEALKVFLPLFEKSILSQNIEASYLEQSKLRDEIDRLTNIILKTDKGPWPELFKGDNNDNNVGEHSR